VPSTPLPKEVKESETGPLLLTRRVSGEDKLEKKRRGTQFFLRVFQKKGWGERRMAKSEDRKEEEWEETRERKGVSTFGKPVLACRRSQEKPRQNRSSFRREVDKTKKRPGKGGPSSLYAFKGPEL